MADDAGSFATRKFNFLAHVAADATLPRSAARVAILFATKFMRAEGGGWALPSVGTIAAHLNLADPNTVRDSVKALVGAGHLEADARRGATTRYRMRDSNAHPWANTTGDPCAETQGDPSGETPAENRLLKTVERDSVSSVPPNDSLDSAKRPRKGQPKVTRSLSRSSSAPAALEEFWRAYPRRVARPAALSAWRRAVEGGADPSTIVAGAQRYAIERGRVADPGERDRFTKHPSTWLKAEGWDDEPIAASEPGGSAEQRFSGQSTLFERAFRGRV